MVHEVSIKVFFVFTQFRMRTCNALSCMLLPHGNTSSCLLLLLLLLSSGPSSSQAAPAARARSSNPDNMFTIPSVDNSTPRPNSSDLLLNTAPNDEPPVLPEVTRAAAPSMAPDPAATTLPMDIDTQPPMAPQQQPEGMHVFCFGT